MKGISPLVAATLIVAMTVAVAGILNIWLMSFTKTSVEDIGEKAETQISCSNANVAFSYLTYCNGYLSGSIENTGLVELTNISLQVIYTNATIRQIDLCEGFNKAVECSKGNLTLSPSEEIPFNVSLEENYKIIKVISNCVNAKDELEASEISVC